MPRIPVVETYPTRRQSLHEVCAVLGAQQLAPDGPGEAVLTGIRADEGHDEGEGAAELRRLYRNDCRDLGWDTLLGAKAEPDSWSGTQGSIMAGWG